MNAMNSKIIRKGKRRSFVESLPLSNVRGSSDLILKSSSPIELPLKMTRNIMKSGAKNLEIETYSR